MSHQSPVSGSLNWLHTPTMSSIRLCWVADIEEPRADLGIPASSNRERVNILMFYRETLLGQSKCRNVLNNLNMITAVICNLPSVCWRQL